MRIRSILAFLILLFACALQSWFVSMDIFINFMLATLIVFAFFFDIWELLVFLLFGVLVINWQPAFSLEIVLFTLIPLLVFASYKFFSLMPSVAAPTAIALGLFALYIIIAPTTFFANVELFFIDVFGALIFGELVFLALSMSNP